MWDSWLSHTDPRPLNKNGGRDQRIMRANNKTRPHLASESFDPSSIHAQIQVGLKVPGPNG